MPRWIKTSGRRTPIGLDIGSRAIKAVQLMRWRNRMEITAAAMLTRAEANHLQGADLAAQLRMMFLRGGFTGNDLVVAVPSQKLEVDVLELPPSSSAAPLAQIARIEMSRVAKLENEPFEIAFWELPAPARASAGTTALAVAVRETDAIALLDPLESAGFVVEALDTQSWAVARACNALLSQPSAAPPSAAVAQEQLINAVLDLGWNSGRMTLLHEGMVIYERKLEQSGIGLIVGAISEEFELGPEEAELVLMRVGIKGVDSSEWGDADQCRRLSQVIERSVEAATIPNIDAALNYASHRYRQQHVEKLWIVGAGSGVPGLSEHLASRLSVNAARLAPANIGKCPQELMRLCGSGVLTTAMGLAMHGE